MAIGIGGAGNDLLTHLMEAGLKGVHCIAADTDRYHLQIARAHSKLFMEDAACSDAGTEGNVEVGKKAALQASQELQTDFDRADLVFVLAGVGGGTGSGAAPIIAEIARKSGSLVVGLITKPFLFERSKFNVAIETIRLMLNVCDTLILLENQSPEATSLTLPFRLDLDATGQACCSVVSSITQAFTNPTLLNGDARELRAMLRRGGLARVGTGDGHSLCSVEEAALNALRRIMPFGDLTEARGVFVNIVGDEKVQDSDLACALELVSRKINPDAEFLCARLIESTLQGGTRVSLLATGVSFPYSWGGYRRFPIEIYELEPESGEDGHIGLDWGLDQLEAFTIHVNL